jgi:hypothetical protein
VAYAAPDDQGRARGEPWAAVTWAFFVDPLDARRCRLVSRYRCASSGHLAMRLSLGPTLIEPIGFAMDRKMLLGVKERAERRPPPSAGQAARAPQLLRLRARLARVAANEHAKDHVRFRTS